MVSEHKMDPVMLFTFVACHTKHCMDMHGIMCRPVPVIVRDFTYPLRLNQFLLLNRMSVGFVAPVCTLSRYQFTNSGFVLQLGL